MQFAMSSSRILSTLRIGPHSRDILDILIGSLLGDGSMEKDDSGSRFCFYQEKSNGEYLIWLHAQISALGYAKVEIPQISSRVSLTNTLDSPRRYIFRFRTFTYTSFNWIYNGFYTKNGLEKRRKVLPTWVGDYITPQVLAIWIMDDGTPHKDRGLRFCTNSFTLSEVKFLGKILENKFNLTYSIHKTGVVNQYGLYLPKKNLDRLTNLVKPYMHKTMLYKLGLYEKP